MDAEVAQGHMGAKLAFTRLSFNYFISEAVFDYIVDAVHLRGRREGWKLLPLYRFDPDSGLWQHRDGRPVRRRAWPPRSRARPPLRHRARERPGGPARRRRGGSSPRCRPAAGRRRTIRRCSEEFERVRWFPLPGDALAQLLASQA